MSQHKNLLLINLYHKINVYLKEKGREREKEKEKEKEKERERERKRILGWLAAEDMAATGSSTHSSTKVKLFVSSGVNVLL